jgi:membrane-associated phospholipid phosphatase
MARVMHEYFQMTGQAQSARVAWTTPCVRRSEWVLWAFLVYVAIMAAAAPLPRTMRVNTIGLNLALLAGYGLLVSGETVRPRKYLRIARDWLPLALTLLAYREMGWFAVPHATHSLEARWVIWDHVILRGAAKAVIESLGPVLPSILEMAYLLVYTLGPFSVAMLYAYDRQNRVDQFLFLFLVGVLLCYGQFPFWPSEPPRTVFPTEDLPVYASVFRHWNLWLLGMGGIHTSVFPSAHVAAAFSAATGMWRFLPEHKWVGRLLGVMAVTIAVATVYGRYHYLADVGAGMLMAGVALLIACLLGRSRNPKVSQSSAGGPAERCFTSVQNS